MYCGMAGGPVYHASPTLLLRCQWKNPTLPCVHPYASHVTIQIACPKYPESKDRMPNSFSFISHACMRFQARLTMLCTSV